MKIRFRFSLQFFLGLTLIFGVTIALFIDSRRKFLTAIESLSTAGIQIARYDTPAFDILPQLGVYRIRIDTKIGADELTLLRKFRHVRLLRWDNPDSDDLLILQSIHNIEEIDIRNATDSICQGLAKAKTLRSLSVSGKDFTGCDLSQLEALSCLRSLDLSYSAVVDDSVKKISLLSELDSLFLAYTKITDLGIDNLELRRLHSLDLNGTHVSDACLQTIAKLSSLSYLNVRGTEISEDGICTQLAGGLRNSLRNICVTSVALDSAGVSLIQRTFPLSKIDATLEVTHREIVFEDVVFERSD